MIQTFWAWFWQGKGAGKSGARLLVFSWRIPIHSIIALCLLMLLNANPFEFASKALFPAASILISMAVAWTSRAATILQDREFRKKVMSDRNPIEGYIYGYQLSLLIIVSMVVYVSLMASGGFNFVIYSDRVSTLLSGFGIYFLLSLSVGQCWQVINFSNLLTLLYERSSRESS